ncbi:MAG: PQQ-binding-like beta-propeller repeat protein [Proteobacteria bacterium]|nr:PQQ-binding-like beta-propeller repeat protein [Pseudomonadota bacterium]
MNRSVRLAARSASRATCWLGLTASLAFTSTTFAQNWPSAGVDLNNSHFQKAETQISPKTVTNLRQKWSFATAGDVTAIPAVVNGYVYFPDSAGYIYKVNAATGQLAWSQPVSVAAITGAPNDFARATPAITGNTLIIGTQSGRSFVPPQLIALDIRDGSLIWKMTADSTAQAFITNSAVIAPGRTNGIAIVGIASNEELTAAFVPPSFWQWQFRGSALAVDVATGERVWQTYVTAPGYYGNAIWGSTASVDLARNQVYVATGDTYMAPPGVLNCLALGGGQACVDPTNYADAIVALDLTTGKVKWAGRGWPYDVWSVACGLGVPGFSLPGPFVSTPGIPGNCPDTSDPTSEYQTTPKVVGPDYDFAQGPMLFSDTGTNDLGLVGAGEKSGVFWTFRAKDGAKVWATQVSPGGVTGGMQWGSATDGSTLYVSASNAGTSLSGGGQAPGPWKLANGQVVRSGGWAAVDAATGKVKWTTPDPYGSRAEGPVTLANGVVFGCNMQGTMFALNAKTGSPLWQQSLASPNACTAGAAISNGMVFWGSGDGRGNPGAAKTLFAFGL